MNSTIVIPISESSQVGEARRTVQKLADAIGFDEVGKGQLAIAITEAATNILKHAGSGEILLQHESSDDRSAIQAWSVDTGPGMRNGQLCLEDGYSTGGTQGNGLGAIRRLADTFDFYSEPDKGCVIYFEKGTEEVPSLPQDSHWSVATLAFNHPAEDVCGDAWSIQEKDDDLWCMVCDGLGHGVGAQEAAQEARHIFEASIGKSLPDILTLMHRALQKTRGAAVGLVRIRRKEGFVDFIGSGNIAGAVIQDESVRHLMGQGGIVGHQLSSSTQLASLPWSKETLLVLHSDGFHTRWSLNSYRGIRVKDPHVIAAMIYRDARRGHDDATVLVARENRWLQNH